MAVYLLLSKIQVHNANAMSSPYTVGFPAMTAWLGASHALERKLQAKGYPNIRFLGVAVASHACNVQLYKGPNDCRSSLVITANPLKKSKKGIYERPPFIEEARCHLCVSLLLRAEGIDGRNKTQVEESVVSLLWRMKFAGGDIEDIGKVEAVFVDEETDADEHRLLRRLMPSYVLVERRDLLTEEVAGEGDALDRLINVLAVEYKAHDSENGRSWQGHRKIGGLDCADCCGIQGYLGHGECEASAQFGL